MPPIRLEGDRRRLFDRLIGVTPESDDRIQPRAAGLMQAPLSFGQERLWFLNQLQPGLPMYTMLGVVHVASPCDVTALRRALDALVRRHESLRTIFPLIGDQPCQSVLPLHPVVLSVTDLRGSSAPAAAQEAAAIFLAESRKPFSLDAGPLFRPHLVRLPGPTELLIVSVHHIVCDGWSMSIMRREVETLYANAVSAARVAPETPPLQYADYAIWQRGFLTESRLDALREFWRGTLAGAPALSLPPPDRPAPRAESGRGANQSFAIDAGLVGNLSALADREQATLFMVLLSALAATLDRHGDAHDWVIGTPVANRDRLELEQVVGFLVNTLPLRIHVDPEATVAQLLRSVRETSLAAFAHQALPFDRIVDAVQPQRHLGHNPLFQVMFALQNMPDRPPTAGAVPTEGSGPPEECVARFAQGWFLAPDGDRLVGSVEYATDLYDHGRISRLIEQFRAVLAAFAAGRDLGIHELRTIPERENRELTAFSHGKAARPGVAHALFEAQAQRHPGITAVDAVDGAVTYAELERLSSAVAAELHAQGIRTEDAVAICVERGAWLAPAVLGVLQAGAVCVPIDMSLPASRIAFTFEDARVRAIVTTAATVVQTDGRARLNVDAPLETRAWSAPRCDPDQLAYIIYTSGSTGTPKGVAMTHGALSNLVEWETARGRYAVGERTTLFAPLGFDVSFQEMFSAWASGGTLVIVPSEVRSDAEHLGRWMVEHRIDRAFLPPLMLRALAESAPDGLMLGELVIAGEALEITRPIARLCERGRTRLVNEYGPAETHVSTAHTLDRDPRQWETRPAIGTPIDGHAARVLARDLRVVPVGCPGEVYLAGAGLARGYLGRPDATADRFIPDPYGPPGSRMYRTGDRGRWRPDGTLEFLGRVDDQVKIRGFRVEPGEIESVLRAHPDVSEAAVAIEAGGENRQAAIIGVVEARVPLASADLKTYLRERLPEYMVPRNIICVERIPRSANGKIDRRTLGSGLVARSPQTPPRTEIEKRLAAIWSSLLGVTSVGIDDDFFELGGHSLLATQMVSRIRRELGAELPVRALFEMPTIAALAAVVAPAAASGSEVLWAASPEPGPAPLSFAQERLWFLQQLSPQDSTYNIGEVVTFDGAYDAAAFVDVWQELASRHPSLCTRFVDTPEGPRQIAQAWPLTIATVDITEVPASMRRAELRRLRERERQIAFDLSSSPPIRALIAIEGPSHSLILTMHHILADGWSLPILREELRELHAARRVGRHAVLPPAPLSYTEYTLRQRQELDESAMARQLAFWRRELEGAPTEIALPLDVPRSGDVVGPGAMQTFRIPAATHTALTALARAEHASAFMVLLAASAVLLRQYTGQEDLLIGTPVANRTRAEFERTIGFFVNTVVIRVQLQPNQTFREVVRHVRDRVLAALAHQDVPFERVVQALKPERDPGVHPLFQVMCVVNSLAADEIAAEMTSADAVANDTLRFAEAAAKFDLTLGFDETAEGVLGAIEYRSDRFDHAAMWRLVEYERRLLSAVAENPDAMLDDYDLSTPAERQFALIDVNRDTPASATAQTLHDLVAQRAATHPNQTAVEWCAETLTYDALWRRATQLAVRLRQSGVRPGDVVGVMIPRSPDWIVATVGVLAAGAAYLPIDVSLPEERVRRMTAPAWGVVVSEVTAGLAPASRLVMVCGDQASAAGDEPLPIVDPRSAAYVIHTSGSTGVPRAVVVEHAAATGYAAAAAQAFQLDRHSRVLQFTSPAFDVAMEEVFASFAAGATLVLRTDDMLDSPAGFLTTCRRLALTTLILPTAYWQVLVPEISELPATLRLVVIGGEQASVDAVDEWHRVVGGRVRLMNAYGPTETTISATMADLSAPLPRHRRPPIGRSFAGARAYVLGDSLRPEPIGIAGELCIAGPGLARGYLGDAAATAERFIPDPLGPPGSRMYRTGDRARLHGDGLLEFIGRRDAQVKVRGYRLELADVEAALCRVPGVTAAAATTRPATDDLVAAVQMDSSLANERGILEVLSHWLPRYMVPSRIVPVPAIPVTVSGKIDRRRIAALASESEGSPKSSPTTALEVRLCAIWAAMLGVPSVGVDENFFHLGGHSLLATRVVARIRDEFGVEVSIRALFEAGTVATLAKLIPAEPAAAPVASRSTSIGPTRRTGVTPIASFAQERLWFMDRLAPGVPLYNLPAVMTFEGPFNPRALREAIAVLVERHATLRTRFVERDGRPCPVVMPIEDVPLAVVDLCDVAEDAREGELSRLVTAEARHAFDLASGPLVRALLVRLRDDVHVLLFTLHHIAADGWSLEIIRRELRDAYHARSAGVAPALPTLPIEYSDYAAWQRERLDDRRMGELIRWWRSELAGGASSMPLPLDRPRPANRRFEGHWQLFSLHPSIVRRVSRLARSEGATPFMILLAAFDALLSRWSGASDIVIGTPVAGREDVALEPMVGFFVNTLPLRTVVQPQESFRQLIAQVRQRTLAAYAHQELPFERLVGELQAERSLVLSPVFQVVFALQNVPMHARTNAPAADAGSFVGTCTAKYDLTLSLEADGAGLTGYIEYATDVFDDETISSFAGAFERLLVAATDDPDASIATLPAATEEDMRTVMAAARGMAPTELPADVIAALQRWARLTPHAIAVSDGRATLTYSQLAAAAAALAGRLRAAGVRDETPVAIRLHRSCDYVVAVAGVLWAGGAFVPIDPGYPRARVAFLLADSGARVLIENADHPSRDTFPALTIVSAMSDSVVLEEAADVVAHEAHPEQTAYIIYTSGSTGEPKGVAVMHRGLRNLCASYVDRIGLNVNDRQALTSSTSFDASVSEIWPPLCAGAALYVVDDDMRLAPSQLAAWIEAHKITVMFLVTPLAESALEHLHNDGGSLRWLLTGGDRLTRRPPVDAQYKVLNQYGPTECSVCATSGAIDAVGDGAPSIGTPIPGVSVYVLDGQMQPVPPGVIGELYVGGPGVARGYLHHPARTAESFMPDPFGSPGTRMYRTGDLARWHHGELEFHGRLDRQVKIRGLRLELGEIEAALARCCGAGAGCVRVTAANALIGYLDAGAPPTKTVLEALRAQLPGYMIPNRIVRLDSLPVSSSGKLDERALAEAANVCVEVESRPLNVIEERVAAIWREVLAVPAVHAEDDFFALGGHSLLLMQVGCRVRDDIGPDLQVRTLFELPTLEGMASEVLVRLLEAMSPSQAERALAAGDSYASATSDARREMDAEENRVAIGASAEEPA